MDAVLKAQQVGGSGLSPIAQHKPTCFGLTQASTSMLVHHWITRAVTLTAAPISVEAPSMDAVLKAQQVGVLV
ncbi:hypothetical protein [Legionella impletisoli]|uniref:Uncharacterized protein n=1 Tax=Legionella impletisoli TaxID=343510 RepID=A0A917N9F1_9GAMM|nr:hypothetical protein [Legionella impletisoli]GGI78830.1 hypothetical protein GCM10007966_04260 [Legionella impletisoli]